MLLRSVELLRHVATSPCGCWFIVLHKVECLCLRRLLLLYSKYRRLQVVKFTTHSEYGKMPAHGYSIEINRRHDQVRPNAHDTLEIGGFCGDTVNRPCARPEDS